MCLFSLYFVIYMVFIVWKALKNILDSFVANFVLRMSDFGGRWPVNLKNRGRSKKTEGRTRPKSRGGSLAVGTYLQRGSAPPPPPPGVLSLLALFKLTSDMPAARRLHARKWDML